MFGSRKARDFMLFCHPSLMEHICGKGQALKDGSRTVIERGYWHKFCIWWEEIFWGRRNAYLRVGRADPWDAEQNICRMDKQQIELLGTHTGCKVNLTSVVPADYKPGKPYGYNLKGD